jgi:3-oxoacyl-[acyl-carrier-protein] synthase I
MRRVYFGTDNIITSLGFTTEENAVNIRSGISGIKVWNEKSLYPSPVAFSRINTADLESNAGQVLIKFGLGNSRTENFTRLEKMFLVSISRALEGSGIDPSDPKTVLIFSTTKGNVDGLVQSSKFKVQSSKFKVQGSTWNMESGTWNSRLMLWEMAKYIAKLLNCHNVPIVVSNACTSGSVAIMQAARMIRSGQYDHAIVTGGDIITEFVISGFQSFQALSPDACRPFDADRTGLSLGEGCGTVILTSDPQKAGAGHPVHYLGGATSNDANHISGPSRDGEGLYLAVSAAMAEAETAPPDIDFISAHGTATPYNDEMESLALAWAGLDQVPVNSFKGYIGHTLGAAGIIEIILSIYSIKNNILFKSIGYQNNGVSRPLNIIRENTEKPIRTVLKTASGFGGCNAAILFTT